MSTTNFDSEFCGSLPVHLINLIQPYGVLLVVERESRKIIQLSENAAQVFQLPIQKVLNTYLDQYLDEDALNLMRDRYPSSMEDKVPSVWKIRDRSYLTIIHQKEKFFLVEMDLIEYEEQKQESFVKVYQEIKLAMGLIQGATSIREVADITAHELKRISGFDKVMIYRFDEEWNGTVLAEEKEDGMESYLGITFPASDIPKQSRGLYHKNPFRLIPNREYQPVKLFPVINPLTQAFLDLSDCNLRSVPAVHIEYLRNMNVMASMSTRILSEGKLWGLIACHHRTPNLVTFEMRSIFEMISNVVSSRVQSVQGNEQHILETGLRKRYNDLVEELYRAGHLQQGLFYGTVNVLQLFNAGGAAVYASGKLGTLGDTPSREEIQEFLLWVHARHEKSVYATDCLAAEYEQASGFRHVASGVLVIPVGHGDDVLILFRPEELRVINWGGNPDERIRFDEDLKNYHPRNSFKLWRQMVEGRSVSWQPQELATADALRSFIFEYQKQL